MITRRLSGVLLTVFHALFVRRSKQYVCFQKLIYVYETEPENVEKLMQLMQDVQE